MNPGDFEGEELLLRRLREAASGDAGLRQLRRRYDSLRSDYEQLLDRLTELEERLEEPAKRPQTTQPVAGIPAASVSEALATPLLRLRDEYLAAATRIQAIVSGLEVLAAGSLKGQHGPRDAAAPAQAEGKTELPTVETAPEPEAPSDGRPRKVHIDLRGSGFGELLDFQERLSTVQGVSRVSINAIDADRATLIVELEPQASEPE
ncbi:MAG: hypothetical protein ABI305_06085 [Tepidiformaceae bacterium]